MLLLAPPALAQDRPEPTARELWREYPLHQSPHPAADGTAIPSPAGVAAASTASAPTGAATPEDGRAAERSDRTATLLLLGLLATIAAVAFVRFRRRPPARQPAPAPQANGRPAPAPAPGGRPARLLPDRPRPAERAGTGPRPPDAVRRWTAEVEWEHGDDGESRFRAVARCPEGGDEVTVARSPALEWPPARPAEVEAMSAAADRLEAALLEAGWTALPPGAAWYAKRFAWEPQSSPSTR